MDWKTVISIAGYVFIGAATLAITYASLKLKIIDRILAERLALEQEKTAKERKAREEAEAHNAYLLEQQKIILEQLKEVTGMTLETSRKADAVSKALAKNDRTLKKQNKHIKNLKSEIDDLS